MLPNGLMLDVHYDVQCRRPEVSGPVINRVYIKVQTLLISKPDVSGPVKSRMCILMFNVN